MTGYQLRAWRKERKWSQALMAEKLDVGLRTYIRWEERGPRSIPRLVELACKYLSLTEGSDTNG